ncbi:hypothetical protein [Ideonella sp.]|uniref:hypothetical protein n=1 Tax=Ideonella sp. TaxID=1929293 RepID=UPI0037BFF3C4
MSAALSPLKIQGWSKSWLRISPVLFLLCLAALFLLPRQAPVQGFGLWYSEPGEVYHSPEQALASYRRGEFDITRVNGAGRPQTGDDCWWVLEIPPNHRWGSDPRLTVGMPLLDRITLYRVHPGDTRIDKVGEGGLYVPPAARHMRDRQAAFRLADGGPSHGMWLIQVHATSNHAVTIHIESQGDHTTRFFRENLLLWTMVTFCAAVYLGALWAAAVLKDDQLYVWATLIAGFTLYALAWNGVLAASLDWHHPGVVHATLLAATWLAGISIASVLRAFLPDDQQNSRAAAWLVRWGALAAGAGLVSLSMGGSIILGAALWTIPLFLVAPWIVWHGVQHGQRYALRYGGLFIFHTLSVGYQYAGETGLVPLDALSMYGWQVVAGVSIAGLLLNIVSEITRERQAQLYEQATLKRDLQLERDALRQKVQQRASELEKANADLMDAEQAHRRLLSMASHEFRTPAAMIKASLDSLRYETTPPAADTVAPLAELRKTSEQLVELTNRVILLDQWRQWVQSPQLHSVDLREWLLEMAGDYSEDMTLGLGLPDDDAPCVIRADTRLLRGAFTIVINHALARSSRQPNAVILSLSRCTLGIQVCVTDDGPRLSPAEEKALHDALIPIEPLRLTEDLGWSMVSAVGVKLGGRTRAEVPDAGGLNIIMALPPIEAGVAA